jgi:hypothetical protein
MRGFIAAFSRARNRWVSDALAIGTRAMAIHFFARFVRFVFLVCSQRRRNQMTLSTHLQPIVALIAGVLILIMPRLLNFIVAIYLILVGIIGLGIIK